MSNPHAEEGMVKVHFGSDIIDLLEQKDGRLSSYIFEGSVKSAASDLFSREDIQRLSPPRGKFGIHKVVIGSQELYGYNRNADGYPADGLIRNCHTFEKIALCFREHDNKDPRKSLGSIKEARWDPRLQRIETFSWVDIDKAPEEYETARRGEELAFSQACRVREDECSCCHHKAASSRNYCEHLRNMMLQYLPSFQKYAFAINRDPKFFDESFVKRGADRIARYLAYKFTEDDDMRKAASSLIPDVISGSEWAEAMGFRAFSALDPRVQYELEKLAADEAYLADLIRHRSDANELRYSALASFRAADIDTDALRTISPGTMMNKFARAGVLLPFDCFIAYATARPLDEVRQDEALMKAAAEQLPVLFQTMKDKPCGQGEVDLFDAAGDYSSNTDPSLSPVVDAVFAEANAKFSAKDDPAQSRVVESIFMGGDTEKKASAINRVNNSTPGGALHPLVSFYGAFKLASVMNIQARPGHLIDADMLRKCACIQNFNF